MLLVMSSIATADSSGWSCPCPRAVKVKAISRGQAMRSMRSSTFLLAASLTLHQAAALSTQPRVHVAPSAQPRAHAVAQFGFKVQKSERLLIREAWERADAYRPGQANWFTKKQKDLVRLHEALKPELERQEAVPPPSNATSLLGALLKVLTTGDLALTLCSPEAPVLTELRDWLVATMPMRDAINGLPEEQGRVLATLVRALDARRILDLGTYTGYSSIAMALAAADDAMVTCCEKDRRYANDARDWWLKAGVSSKMQMFEKDAVELLRDLNAQGKQDTYDMVFVDISERHRYAELHEPLIDLMRVGGVIVYYDTLWAADRVVRHEPNPTRREFNYDLAKDPRVIATLVPLSYGITVCVKTMNLDGPALAAAREQDARDGGDEALHELLRARRSAVEAELAQMPPAPPS